MANPRRFRWGFALLGVLLVGLIIWAVVGAHKPAKTTKAPVVAVTAAKAVVRDVPVAVTAIGAAQAWQGVVIRAQVNGVLKRVPVHEGSYVAAGDLLAEIDSAPYRAALMQAQGALKRDRALLDEARIDLKRFQTLASQDSIAKQQVDTQGALVKQDEGTVLIDQGAVAAAQVNVNYCRITAPVSGRVGVRLVDPGNIVSTSDTTGIITVNQIMPIAVTFTVPQGDFQKLSDVSKAFTQPLVTQALSQETGGDLGSGELSIADNHVDATTGTVQMKARFPNASKHLWPNQFVNVRLTLQTLKQVTTIPATAVNQGPKGAFAYVVGPDRKVVARPITVTTTQDALAVVKSGVEAGDMVVTDGQLSLKPGSVVAVRKPSAQKPAP
jgi:multidrug efflux system membrane fusion protein